MPQDQPKATPAYQRVKDFILKQIESGEWAEGALIPTELELARRFDVSRMTANRALRELSQENRLTRVQGAGTYVAQQRRESTLLRLRSIVDEIEERGGAHRSELHLAERIKADKAQAARFGLKPGDLLLHSIVVHFENDVPIQLEDRLVNAAVAPDYLDIDFRIQTANEYLMRAAPLQGVEFVIESQMPPASIAEMLAMDVRQPCLVLRRKTLSRDQTASMATMWHPGPRYRFSGRF